jgi:GNAT superfamily N-acetyltransferase
VRIRQAVAADLGAVADLAALAGVRLEDAVADGVIAGSAGGALRAGLRDGQEAFVRHLAEQFIAHPEEQLNAYLSAALILVAEHREHGVIGALIAYPPSNVALDHLRQAKRRITDPRELSKLAMAGAIWAAKVKAVATAAHARGAGVGSALIQCCSQVYFRCGYVMVYGQMPAVPGLDAFYRRNGFDVLDVGDELDMWVVFGVHSRIRTDPDERFFIRQVPAASR